MVDTRVGTSVAGVPAAGGNPVGRWLANRRIGTKFGMLIVVAAATGAGVGLTALSGMASMQASSDRIYAQNLVPITELAQARSQALSMRSDVLNAGVSADPVTAQKFAGKIPADDAAFDQAFAGYIAVAPAARAADIDLVKQGTAAYRQVRDATMLPAALRGDFKTFSKARDETGLPAFTKINTGLDNLVKDEIAGAKAENAASRQTYTGSRLRVILFLVIGLALASAFGLLMARLVTGPVGKVATVLAGLAEGDLTHTARVASTDELGRMAQALDQATGRLRSMIGSVGDSSRVVASSATELSAVTQQIASSAEATTARATNVSAAAEQVTRNIETVSAGSEEMGVSIREIADNAAEAAAVVQQAVTAAAAATSTVSQLGNSSGEIGNVIKTITAIAEQTNLLALNATIEAARAGEAGKGFAVVASEVKDLAQETTKATEDISRRIQAIQGDATAAVDAIAQITDVIERISDYSTTIASAVEEQTATTGEISRNVTEAATGSAEIAQNITGVATAVQTTTEAMDEARRAIEDMARMSNQLQHAVDQFRC
jgi:methyl-accepting chemotaxis protein